MTNEQNKTSLSQTFLVFAFWAYVLIPLGWGVFQTLKKALELFR